MSSSKEEFEALKRQKPLNTFEHIGYPDTFVVDPECLIVISLEGHPDQIYGLHYCTVGDLQDFILFRAADLCQCSMVAAAMLKLVRVKLLTPEGHSWFRFDPENFTFKVSKQNADTEYSAE
jgi:hypothetical protein